MIAVEEAQERVFSAFSRLAPETVSLDQSLARVLAAPVVARRTHPPAAMSAMDGYALRAADAMKPRATLRLAGVSAAGNPFEGAAEPGTCIRIFTGAPLPEGTDAVIIQEDSEAEGDAITFAVAAEAGQHVRRAGIDFTEGDQLLGAGRQLTPADIALAAAGDVPWLSVQRRPRVALIATGDELVMPGEPRGPGQIVSSNNIGLAAFIRACGGEPADLGIAPDDADALQQMAAGARGADLLLTIGGASVGDHDLVQKALKGVGLEVDFWRIAMRPGKPLIFGKIGETPMIGLPGNPASAFVCSLLFVRGAIRRMLGLAPGLPEQRLPLAAPLPANGKRQDYMRACVENGTVSPVPVQDSSLLSALSRADCLIVRPPHAPEAAAGDDVSVIPLNGIL